LIQSGQRQVNQFVADFELSIANFIERAFKVMRECRKLIEPEHRTRSFYGMKRAKRPAHQFLVAAMFI
jgi:hypothetical protein